MSADVDIPAPARLRLGVILGETSELLYDRETGDIVPTGGESAGSDTTPEGRLATLVDCEYDVGRPKAVRTYVSDNEFTFGNAIGVFSAELTSTPEGFRFLHKRFLRDNYVLPIRKWRWRMTDSSGGKVYFDFDGVLFGLREGGPTLSTGEPMSMHMTIQVINAESVQPT